MTFLRRHRASSTTVEPNTPAKSSGFWSVARLLLAGTVGIGALSLVATLAGSAWLTANQRSEAEKPAPWADPSFTTTAITTGGLISRWTDNDGNPENGHSYIQGIYSLWIVKHPNEESALVNLPPLWDKEVSLAQETQANRARNERQATAEQVITETADIGGHVPLDEETEKKLNLDLDRLGPKF